MSDTIILPVRGKHFGISVYDNCCNCPIARAAKELFSTSIVAEWVSKLKVNDKWYRHKQYNEYDYIEHHALAAAAGYDETIIFNLELKEV